MEAPDTAINVKHEFALEREEWMRPYLAAAAANSCAFFRNAVPDLRDAIPGTHDFLDN